MRDLTISSYCLKEVILSNLLPPTSKLGPLSL
nr:MAG TPA: hypothetical protein [Caudoviricetes sp.]